MTPLHGAARPATSKAFSVLFIWIAVCGAGKLPPYDPAAVPDAAAERQRRLDECQAKSLTLQTIKASVDCTLKAYRAYAVREKLHNMALFEDYAKIALDAASDVDAGKLTRQEGQRRIAAARINYENQVATAYSDFKKKRSGSKQSTF